MGFAVSLSTCMQDGFHPINKVPSRASCIFPDEPSLAVGWSLWSSLCFCLGHPLLLDSLLLSGHRFVFRFRSAVSFWEVSPVASLPWWTAQPPWAVTPRLLPWAGVPLSLLSSHEATEHQTGESQTVKWRVKATQPVFLSCFVHFTQL